VLTLWGVISAVTVFGGIPTVGGLWMFERWRSRRRNRGGECASCGISWSSTSSGEPYLIHGRLVCEDCAEVARRRMPWHFATIGIAAAAVGIGVAWDGGGLATAILWPIGSTLALTLGAVQMMKLANRKAQRRIAAGEFPDMKTLGPGAAEAGEEGTPTAAQVQL